MHLIRWKTVLLLITTLFSPLLHAEIKPAKYFTDHMVLQRGGARIWGSAEPGETVTVRFRGQATMAKADAKGRWLTKLATGKAGGPFTLALTGSSIVELKDILVGEVWLGGGQSNMHMALQDGRGGVVNAKAEIAAADHPQIRLLQIPNGRDSHDKDFADRWAVCSPKSAKQFSAALYFFARRLHGELNVPIGIINASRGGSSIKPWLFGNNHYQLCIANLVPMKLRGILWYQGEADTPTDLALIYGEQLRTLVTGWREAFGEELPFYAAQLASCFAMAETGHIVRDQTICTLAALPRTGIISTSDISDLTNIHPKQKQEVGLRFANLALRELYGREDLPAYSPSFKAMKISGKEAIISFDHAEGGFTTRDGEAPDWFQIAGDDKVFHWADAAIDGESIRLSAPEVTAPKAVRYSFSCTALPNLMGKVAELPVLPFRTDDWDFIAKLPAPKPLSLARLTAAGDLAKLEPLRFVVGGRAVGLLRLGILGDAIHLEAEIRDPLITPASADWKSAMVELYAAALDDDTVHQVVIALKGPGTVETGEKYIMGKTQGPVPLTDGEVTLGAENGYTLRAAFPLAALNLTGKETAFRIESATGLALAPKDKRNWISLFGSASAFKNPSRFRKVNVSLTSSATGDSLPK